MYVVMPTATLPHASSPLFVFLHGWGSRPLSYALALQAASRHTVDIFAPALPGHDGVPMPAKGNRTLDYIAGTLADEVNLRAGERHIILAGHSMGGALATLMCQQVAAAGHDVSLLLLSPTGASPQFGPREWIRAFGDFRQPRPLRRRGIRTSKALITSSLRTSRLGYKARIRDLRPAWDDLISSGVPVTAVHAIHDCVVATEPLMDIDGIQPISIPRPHDWPVWDPHLVDLALQVHLARVLPTRT
jgi:pimeloyl-ACP methyl ester carboxylesterase